VTPVYFEGKLYGSASHAFNAARTQDENIRRRIQKAPTMQEMFNVARTIIDSPNFQFEQLKAMEKI
jgi:hypothetical protein